MRPIVWSSAWSSASLRAVARAVAAAVALVCALIAGPAFADFKPPALTGHVVDTAGRLDPADIRTLDAKLDRIRRQTGFEIVAFIAGSLEGETIEDVAYKAFNTWQLGQRGADNGVLLVIAPSERRVRIETGKGVGGALTDLQSNDIIRQTINPLLQQDRFRDAIDQGTTEIARALIAGTPEEERRPAPGAQPAPTPVSPIRVGVTVIAVVAALLLALVSPTFRWFLWLALQAILFRGGGGGFRGGGGSGVGGGSGFGGGGGGRSGGGGSSDSY
ncbi:TPM domain-containing protein [Sorangium sp. So ce1024]|uniref:TPM domain-containing protein n=1 Tax=Sorangium sp. So ce1024 TaxID=3133327 RepID=UPI003F112E6B